MIVLAQQQDPMTEKWEDLKIPRRSGPPRRGRAAAVQTVEEFADELVKHGLAGTYRVVLSASSDGLQKEMVYRVLIEKYDAYRASYQKENPDVS